MKNRHNKKRNTAFVFEALSHEATVAIIKGDQARKEKVKLSKQIKKSESTRQRAGGKRHEAKGKRQRARGKRQ